MKLWHPLFTIKNGHVGLGGSCSSTHRHGTYITTRGLSPKGTCTGTARVRAGFALSGRRGVPASVALDFADARRPGAGAGAGAVPGTEGRKGPWHPRQRHLAPCHSTTIYHHPPPTALLPLPPASCASSRRPSSPQSKPVSKEDAGNAIAKLICGQVHSNVNWIKFGRRPSTIVLYNHCTGK